MTSTYTLTPGKYVITDSCMAYENYYLDFLLPGFEDLDRSESVQMGSSVIVSTNADGCGVVRTMDNEIVGEYGMDAANVSILPYKVTGDVPSHMGTVVEFDSEFTVTVYDDAMVVGDLYRVRY